MNRWHACQVWRKHERLSFICFYLIRKNNIYKTLARLWIINCICIKIHSFFFSSFFSVRATNVAHLTLKTSLILLKIFLEVEEKTWSSGQFHWNVLCPYISVASSALRLDLTAPRHLASIESISPFGSKGFRHLLLLFYQLGELIYEPCVAPWSNCNILYHFGENQLSYTSVPCTLK